MAVIKVFRNIGELLSLRGAAEKSGRRIRENDLGLIKNGSLVTKSGQIVWTGATRDLPREFRRLPYTSLKGKTVLPAFTECHTHMIFAGQRSDEFERRNLGVSYQDIAREGGGILSTMRATRKASAKSLISLGEERAKLFLRQGVTTLEVKSGYGLDAPSETKMLSVAKKISGPRIVTTYLGPHAVPPEFASAKDYISDIVRNTIPALVKKRLTCRCDIFVEKGFFEEEVARPYLKAVQQAGLDIVIHADQLSLSGGARLAVEFGARSADHLIQIQRAEVEALAKSEVTCVLLPAADLYLKCAFPPARKLLDEGARVALATDFNPGSSPTQDLALVGLLARLEMKMSLPEVISAYTVGASYALGMGKELGALIEGRQADFLVHDGLWTDLFYSAGHMGISGVWKQGRKIN